MKFVSSLMTHLSGLCCLCGQCLYSAKHCLRHRNLIILLLLEFTFSWVLEFFLKTSAKLHYIWRWTLYRGETVKWRTGSMGSPANVVPVGLCGACLPVCLLELNSQTNGRKFCRSVSEEVESLCGSIFTDSTTLGLCFWIQHQRYLRDIWPTYFYFLIFKYSVCFI